jgi:sulfonate transport system ATP-binding protein
MNTLAKLIPATSGSILIHGEEADPCRHNLAYVFQESTSLPWLTVRQNVAYGMEVKNVPRKEREVRLEHILNLVGLADCAELYPNQISASMEQRVSVARAFATHPDLLLMDEPYGQLDVKLRFYLEDELVRLWEHLKSTVIFVTHNIEEAVYLAERIIILTNKPTKIKSEIMVDLPRPRDFLDPEFLRIRKEVTELIRWW